MPPYYAQKNEYPLLAGTHLGGRLTCGPTKLTGTEGFVNLVNINDSSSSDRMLSIQRPSCFFILCSSCSSRSNRHRRDCLLPPPRGRLCCRAGLTAPPNSHRWPSHPSTHPHLLLFSGNGRRTSKPSYSHTPLRVGNNCRVFLPPCRSLPRPRRRPPPWFSRRGLVNVVNDRHASEVDCTWRG